MVNEFKKKRDTAKIIFKRFKACAFDIDLFKQRFSLSVYEKECYNNIYGGAFGKL